MLSGLPHKADSSGSPRDVAVGPRTTVRIRSNVVLSSLFREPGAVSAQKPIAKVLGVGATAPDTELLPDAQLPEVRRCRKAFVCGPQGRHLVVVHGEDRAICGTERVLPRNSNAVAFSGRAELFNKEEWRHVHLRRQIGPVATDRLVSAE